MERLAELISKLKEQFDKGADVEKLLGITMLIERELTKPQSQKSFVSDKPAEPAVSNGSAGSSAAITGTSSKVAVVMPAARNGYHPPVSEPVVAAKEENPVKQSNPVEPASPVVSAKPVAPAASTPKTSMPFIEVPFDEFSDPEIPEAEEKSPNIQPQLAANKIEESDREIEEPAHQPIATPRNIPAKEEPAKPLAAEPARQQKTAPEFIFDPITEIPTLSQQHSVKEINEMLNMRDASLNDKLKENKVEVGHVLKEHPIKDLKKGIGINDRYVFINELFRGDEVMYERSLKTINSFRIYAEAEYWIERELKVKLGWKENEEVTRHFYQLVRRRFS